VLEQVPVGGVRLLSDVERAWLAGVVDGEGSIFITKLAPKLHPRYRRGFFYRAELSVANSDPRLLARVRDVVGKGYFGLDKERSQNPKWRDKWQYKGSGLVLRGILPQILPYMTVKRRNAEAMLRYLEFVDEYPIDGLKAPPVGYDGKLDSLYLEVKQLNREGSNESTEADEKLPSWGPKGRGRGGRATGCRQLGESEKAWLAGVIDGEGSIFLSKVLNPKTRRGFFYLPTLSISNTNRPFLVKVAETIDEGSVCFAKKGDSKTKSRWMYICSSGVIRAILPQILPHMIVKRDRAVMMLRFLEFLDSNPIYGRKEVPKSYYDRLDALYREMKTLNMRGKAT